MDQTRQSYLGLQHCPVPLVLSPKGSGRTVQGAALDLTRSKSELILENALLRQQLIVLQRQTKRPKLTWKDRSLIVLLSSKLRAWKDALIIVQPDTVLRWHRELFKRFWQCTVVHYSATQIKTQAKARQTTVGR